MASAERQALTIAPRPMRPVAFQGSDTAWRALCECYPGAETPDVLLAVLDYCAARKLDPFKKPVHVVPMWNERLRRRVQVVMQGINEIETTASRTKQYAGIDPPVWGPISERTFRGTVEDNGQTKAIEVRMQFPEWCRVVVYRIVNGERRAFAAECWWIEYYARASFRSEVPNARWQQAPRQMLHKCAKAAALRSAFPEEGFGPAAEEMEDRPLDVEGLTLDGVATELVDPPATPPPAQPPAPADERRPVEPPRAQPPKRPPARSEPADPLDEQDPARWMHNLRTSLNVADTADELHAIATDPRVVRAQQSAPAAIKAEITALIKAGYARFADVDEPPPDAPPQDDPRDEPQDGDDTAELLAEIAQMDLRALDDARTNAIWAARRRELFPPDQERIDDAMALRRLALRRAAGTAAT
jgi:phage recombination protein Bet